MATSTFCRHCGSSNLAMSKFCGNCGKPLDQNLPMAESQEGHESYCPKCNQNDKVESIATILQSQSSIVGYGSNKDVKQTQLAEVISHALGSKPRPGFIDKLILGSDAVAKKLEDYEKVGEKWANSYYCSRCALVFFTYKGKKHSSGLGGFRDLIRQDLD